MIAGAGAAYTIEDQERMTRARNYVAWQSRLVKRELGRRVVEVGCGVGNFTEMLLCQEAVVAVDREPECIERLTRRYTGQDHLHAFTCDVLSDEFRDLRRFHADSCVCLNVLEHIDDDAGALRNMAAVIDPGGVIVLIVPAFPALYGPIDRNLGHQRRYSRRSIEAVALAAGLYVRKAHYLNAIGFFGWWANARMLRLEAQSEKQIEFFDRHLVPVMSRVEDVVRPPIGQSLFVVLGKN